VTQAVLAHDYLLVLRGAERTFAAIADCWPDAPIATLLYDREGTRGRFAGHPLRTSPLQRLGVAQKGFRRLMPLFPSAAQRLPVSDAGLVVSSSSAFAHGVRPHPAATHVSYCHSPFRYAWHERVRAIEETPTLLRPLVRRTLARVRRWDIAAAERTTHYVANSELTRTRIQDFWDRDAEVVHPPVDVARFRPGTGDGDYFLVVCELVRHKQVDLALEAAARAGRAVKVVGDGPERERLAARYGSTAEFLGRIGDDELTGVYRDARALILPNVEDFGIAAVEAQAAGRPVVAAAGGGALETVIAGATGVHVPPDDVSALAEALREVDFHAFSPERIAGHARSFSVERFQARFTAVVERVHGAPVGTSAAIRDELPSLAATAGARQ
jgi:glycosyltransferase involved in cell wall biosynthesis